MSKQTLATKYRPKTFDDVVEQTAIKMTLQEQLKTNTIKNCYLFTGGAGTGKAQPLYSKVLTQDGYITMDEVEVGTKVIGCDGEVHTVTATYDRGIRPIYEVSFSDNTKVRCCDEHLWTIVDSTTTNGSYTTELKNIMKNRLYTDDYDTYIRTFNYYVPTPKPTKFSEKHISIPAYVMGVLIASAYVSNDGNYSISIYQEDILHKVKALLEDVGYTVKPKVSDNNTDGNYNVTDYDIISMDDNTYPISWLINELNIYGLNATIDDKCIPKDYLFNSIENRIELLRGILDCCGYLGIGSNSSLKYTTTSYLMTDNIAFLVRSLGGYVCIKTANNNCDIGSPYIYDIYIKFDDSIIPITNTKLLNTYKSSKTNILKFIKGIKYIGNEHCKCIMVDSEEHLYITDGYTVTHNTTDARIFANDINKGIGSPIELDAASNNSVDDVRRIIEDAKYKSMTGEYKVYILDEVHSLSNQAWQSLLKLIEEPPAKTIILMCTTDPQKIPNTILSRVQRYDFRKISFNGIVNRLKYIIEQENKENANIIPTEEGLEYIAKLADGGMRDAITTLDKCISYNNNLTLENVITALGGVNYDIMFNLIDSTYNYESKQVITIIEDIYNSGANIKQFIKDFSDFVLDLCKYGLMNTFDYIRIPSLYANKLNTYTNDNYCFFNQLLGEMIKLSNLIKWESSPKSTIESTFILLCQKG